MILNEIFYAAVLMVLVFSVVSSFSILVEKNYAMQLREKITEELDEISSLIELSDAFGGSFSAVVELEQPFDYILCGKSYIMAGIGSVRVAVPLYLKYGIFCRYRGSSRLRIWWNGTATVVE